MEKVFLGGTCNESTWRDQLIPMLKIKYFNPVVEDWTEDCMQRELQERQTCNFCLYTITPEMAGFYSIAEVVDDSNKRPDKTVLVILEKDNNRVFSKKQQKSLEAVAKMVESNGGKYFTTLEECADFLNKGV